jgi:glycosyltransferase involved in cell wall biosynthesis
MHDPPPAIPFQRASFFVWRRAVGRFLFVSQSARERTERLGRLRPIDRVIYNGVEVNSLELPRQRTDRFVERYGWPTDSVVFGITGQIIAEKGCEEFIEAADGARKANSALKFVIGGRGPEKYLQHLRQLIAARCLDGHVCFCGWLSSATDFYEGIDVLVLASRHSEGFGLVIAEAAERGVPTVGTRSGGASEVVVDRETGLLIDKGDVQGLQEAMIEIGSDERLRRRLGEQARTRVAEAFNLAVQAKKFADLLNESIPGSCGGL